MNESFIDSQIQILERCQASWNTNVMPTLQDDLTPYGLPGMTKTAIANSFSMIISRLTNIKALSLEQSNPFLIQTIAQNFPGWTGPMEGWIVAAPSSPTTIPNIVSHLNIMWSQLNTFDNQPNIPSIEDTKRLIVDIKGSQVEANNLVKGIADTIPEFEGKRDAVFTQCDAILVRATESLAAAARSGLATSFSMRAAEYDKPRVGWFFAFFMSLMAIVFIAAYFILPQVKDERGIERLYYFLTDIPLTLPFIWFAWFSALRFSQLGRLKEDYKFKVATALALDGYRKQAEDLSPTLQEKLLDLAVTNFGENPLRLMTKDSAKDAHPWAGLIDAKGVSEIFREGLKSLFEKNK